MRHTSNPTPWIALLSLGLLMGGTQFARAQAPTPGSEGILVVAPAVRTDGAPISRGVQQDALVGDQKDRSLSSDLLDSYQSTGAWRLKQIGEIQLNLNMYEVEIPVKDAAGENVYEDGRQLLRVELKPADEVPLPEDLSSNITERPQAAWQDFVATSKVFAWCAPDLRYQPLYFEDVALERYGQTFGPFRQWEHSAANFAFSTLLLPFHMYVDPPHSCEYPLGRCRPGSCNPSVRQRYWWPFSLHR